MEKRALIIVDLLNQLFPNPPISLFHSCPYTLLIATLLSAQCTDKMVNKVTPHLFAKASTPKAMAALPLETLLAIIRPCGLSPKKAKAIHALSKILIEKHEGQVPDNFADLEALPGVGHKTASVVLSQAFHIQTFPVDTHIHRCSKRWGLSTGKTVLQTEKAVKKIFPKHIWNKLHLQIIYYARQYCPAKGHSIEKCPICYRLSLI